MSVSSSCGSGLEIQALPLIDGCKYGTPLPSAMWQVAQVFLKTASPSGRDAATAGAALDEFGPADGVAASRGKPAPTL